MFPYRRNGKKRAKNGPQQRTDGQYNGQGQRLPGSARELLRLLQPTTKALAQYLAGNTGQSGQLNHARQVLEQAQYLVEDRQTERLPPREREEFLEQFARLKLTITDAHDLERAHDERGPPDARRDRPVVGPERLREMALALSTPARPPAAPVAEPTEPEPEEAAEPVVPAEPDDRAAESEGGAADNAADGGSGPRGQRLRLRRSGTIVAAAG